MTAPERAELADITFGNAKLTSAEYSANILRLAESKATECESCEINWLNLLLAISGYPETSDLMFVLNVRRICEEELYLHFYGSDRFHL